VLGEALAAVNWPALCRLEGDFRLLPAIRADDLGHLAVFSITQYFHSYFVCMLRTPHGILRTLHTQARSSLLNHFIHLPLETGKTNRVAHARLFYLPFCLSNNHTIVKLVFPCSNFSRSISTLGESVCVFFVFRERVREGEWVWGIKFTTHTVAIIEI